MSDDLAWLSKDLRGRLDGFADEEPTQPRIVVPVAQVRASWWRRFAAWLGGGRITTYCAQCHARLDVHADGVCFWCKSLAAQLDDWRPRFVAPEPDMAAIQEASDLLTELRRKINDARGGEP